MAALKEVARLAALVLIETSPGKSGSAYVSRALLTELERAMIDAGYNIPEPDISTLIRGRVMNIHDEIRMTQLDERDSAILAERQAQFDSRDGPRVGDYIYMLDGTLRRFTHKWGDGLQTTYRWRDAKNRETFDPMKDACGGSFHLGNGYVSFSGSLDDAIPLTRIEDTGETRNGPCWFFHHDWMKAHNGVQASLVCRVYRERAES